ncbi:ABC transporter substrate-binding protein [Silvanigrella aquatica]|uniref:Solute-binding protein family 5 domain-containing protein n=1 Tax=Silvanigrella aquatica TaxID=1915309 RepID=A0A1L4CZK4_9BACT|nr:ABC transporter substrate-binding protein [Silvanigrella aquatica]APJ03379.1 hypothetical protein AXG55_05440 [Silvanigrella aquatica]
MKYVKVIIILFFSFFQCYSFSSIKSHKQDKVIHIGMTMFLKELDPVKAWSHQHYLLFACVYDTLVRLEENGSLKGRLAERWTVSKDLTTYTFYINKQALFHNGDTVTTEDVAWSLSRHLWFNSESNTLSYLQNVLKNSENIKYGEIIPSIEVVDSHTIKFHLKAPYPPFVGILSSDLFVIYQKKNFDPKKPMGSGPFSAYYDTKDEKWIMKKNKNYFLEKIISNEIHFYNLKNTKDGYDDFNNEKLDVLLGFPPEHKLAVSFNDNFNMEKISSARFAHLFFNHNKKIFHNKMFREELAYIVQQPFADENFHSHIFKYNPHFFPKGIMPKNYYNRKPIPYVSHEEFKKKWKYPKKFVILINKESLAPHMMRSFEKAFATVGIRVEWRIVYNSMIEELAKKEFDLVLATYSSNFPDPESYLDPLRQESKFSFGNIPSQNLFQKLETIRYTPNQKERLHKIGKIFQEFEEEYYFIPLFHMHYPYILYKNDIHVPEANYYYESEMWKLHWKEEAKN